MKGRVMPVKGSSRTTPAMMKKAWKPMMMVSPTATSREKSERAVWAMRRPEPTSKRNESTTTLAPSRPISSPMAAKIMSLVMSGTQTPAWPWPRPVPPTPPTPREIQAWATWRPLP